LFLRTQTQHAFTHYNSIAQQHAKSKRSSVVFLQQRVAQKQHLLGRGKRGITRIRSTPDMRVFMLFFAQKKHLTAPSNTNIAGLL
jgi:hypothetical protein